MLKIPDQHTLPTGFVKAVVDSIERASMDGNSIVNPDSTVNVKVLFDNVTPVKYNDDATYMELTIHVDDKVEKLPIYGWKYPSEQKEMEGLSSLFG